MSGEPAPATPARRVVSLVPSLTEALFALEMGERVVGVTDWCVHPRDDVAGLPKVGGTKNPDLTRILALKPDLVVANHEENRRRDVERLREAGVPVWVTYPRTVREGAELLDALAELGGVGAALRAHVVEPVLAAVAGAEARAAGQRPRVFCPIWRDPWMGVGADTYADDLIRLCGGSNPFAEHGDRRYPRVTLDEVIAAAPEVILLPDEPYRFDERDAAELRGLSVPAAESGRIHLIDGTFVSWYGPRIRGAIEKVSALLMD